MEWPSYMFCVFFVCILWQIDPFHTANNTKLVQLLSLYPPWCCQQVFSHPSLVVFLPWTLPNICHRAYLQTSKGHVTWIIKKANRIPTHYGVAYESVCSLARGHVIKLWCSFPENIKKKWRLYGSDKYILNKVCLNLL